MDYAFHVYNSVAETGILLALQKLIKNCDAPPVALCIGSDLAVGDSLGPIVGTMLKENGFCGYVYGTLKNPVTAKEVKFAGDFLKKTHPRSKVIAIDAAVGEETDVGLIKVSDCPLRPGSGANKRLGKLGDVSVLGIVARKSAFSYSLLNLTRLNLVYRMAERIAEGLCSFSRQIEETSRLELAQV